MNTVTFKPRIASPYQVAKKHPFDISSSNHPVRKEIMKHVGKFDLTVAFREDVEMAGLLKTQGLIAFICEVSQNGKILGVGRSNSLISETSKYFEKVIQSSRDYSLVDAISKLVRATDTLKVNTSKPSYDYQKEAMIDDAYKARDSYRKEEMATEKQKSFLLQLIHTNITNKDELALRSSQVDEFTRSEASHAIQAFQK